MQETSEAVWVDEKVRCCQALRPSFIGVSTAMATLTRTVSVGAADPAPCRHPAGQVAKSSWLTESKAALFLQDLHVHCTQWCRMLRWLQLKGFSHWVTRSGFVALTSKFHHWVQC